MSTYTVAWYSSRDSEWGATTVKAVNGQAARESIELHDGRPVDGMHIVAVFVGEPTQVATSHPRSWAAEIRNANAKAQG